MDHKVKGSLDRLLMILDYLADNQSVSAAQAAELLGVDRSNSYRLLKKLEEYGYARKNGHNFYRGHKFIAASYCERTPYEVAAYSTAILKELVKRTNISAHLCMLSNGGATFIHQEFSTDILHVVQPIGVVEPFHCTASGKVMLAFMPKEMLMQQIEKIDFKKFTDQTITTQEELFEQLEIIRRQGYALDEREYHPNVACICVPVFDASHIPRYALGLSSPILSEKEMDYKQLKRILRKYADILTEYLCSM